MSDAIKNTGQLRAFLVDAMLQVKAGTLDPDHAHKITKIAAQVNESFYSEIKIKRVRAECNESQDSLGCLPIGERETA